MLNPLRFPMKTLPALLLLGVSVLPTFACDSADSAKTPDLNPVESVPASAPKIEVKSVAPAPPAPVAPAPKSTGKSREARRNPPPAHLFM